MVKALLIGLAIVAGLAFGLRYLAPVLLDRTYYHGPESGHYREGRFFNPDAARDLEANGPRRFPLRLMIRFMLGRDRAPWPRSVPVIPAKPPQRVDGETMRVTWIGHSTVLVQTQGLNILTDPVWSARASPFGFMGPKRVREPGVRFDDLPKIDLVLVSHNHYDHLDVATLKRLWQRDRPLIVTPLGNDALLAKQGVTAIAKDWGERVPVRPGVEVVIDRVHHWTSRWMFDRNRALWCGFTVVLPGGNLFFAGDTGAGDMRWPEEAARAGPVRLALIPIGAYLPREVMRASHIGPGDAVAIFQKPGAAYALGVHWGTFQLSSEPIDAPPELLAHTLAIDHIAPDRFRTIEAGAAWLVPSLETYRNLAETLQDDTARMRAGSPAPASGRNG